MITGGIVPGHIAARVPPEARKNTVGRETVMVKVYSGPQCQKCRITKKILTDRGVEFVSVDIAEDDEARDYITNTLGFNSLPVVETEPGVAFSGFRPEVLKTL